MSFILFESHASHDQSEARTINIASAVQSENVRASCVRLLIYFVRPGGPTALKEHVTHPSVGIRGSLSDWRQSSLNKIRLRS